jgi:hypothetical protein
MDISVENKLGDNSELESPTPVEMPQETNSGVWANKIKIRKAASVDDDDDIRGSYGEDEPISPVPNHSKERLRDWEKEARTDLIAYLQRNHMDASWAEKYELSIRPTKKRVDLTRKSENKGYTVTFISPSGIILPSKTDLLNDIRESMSGRNNSKSTGNVRETAAEEAQAKLARVSFPTTFDKIRVLSLGTVDTRSGFHSPIYIYPVGYKCEQWVVGLRMLKGPIEQRVICEIAELDGFPEFRITPESGLTVCSLTEAGAWKKVLDFTVSYILDYYLIAFYLF